MLICMKCDNRVLVNKRYHLEFWEHMRKHVGLDYQMHMNLCVRCRELLKKMLKDFFNEPFTANTTDEVNKKGPDDNLPKM